MAVDAALLAEPPHLLVPLTDPAEVGGLDPDDPNRHLDPDREVGEEPPERLERGDARVEEPRESLGRHDQHGNVACSGPVSDLELEQVTEDASRVAELDLDEDPVPHEVPPESEWGVAADQRARRDGLGLPIPRAEGRIQPAVELGLVDREQERPFDASDRPGVALRFERPTALRELVGWSQRDVGFPQDLEDRAVLLREGVLDDHFTVEVAIAEDPDPAHPNAPRRTRTPVPASRRGCRGRR